MLHVGPYEKECETISLMQAFAKGAGISVQRQASRDLPLRPAPCAVSAAEDHYYGIQ